MFVTPVDDDAFSLHEFAFFLLVYLNSLLTSILLRKSFLTYSKFPKFVQFWQKRREMREKSINLSPSYIIWVKFVSVLCTLYCTDLLRKLVHFMLLDLWQTTGPVQIFFKLVDQGNDKISLKALFLMYPNYGRHA